MKFGTVLGGLAAAAALACAGSATAQVTTMFADNFDGATTTASGVTVARTGGGAVYSAAGTFGTASNNFFENRSVSPIVATLWTLSNLPSHDSVTLDFDALFVNTWDSSNGSNSQLVISPDYYDVYLDDVRVLRMTARIASGTIDDFGGGALQYVGVIPGTIVAYVASPTPITIAHSASTFALRVEASGAGWQGGGDESWGLDNLNISANLTPQGGVPEPSAWALMILGFGAAGAVLRRRKAVAA